jgi:hypothetical protein
MIGRELKNFRIRERTFFILNIFSEFRVENYDDLCEYFSKIEKVICLRNSVPKILLLILLNFFTAFIINLFIVWCPSLKLMFIYSKCSQQEAKFVGIHGSGKIFLKYFLS